ncbi:uncharacterized protein DUF3833 [Tamilnaduibacter salinus]|uniref:Uncharacterized protein DUF3833 n=1 Tax=Tamilnaduibacter salinus TaxID=1484056 RepID=A0A2U1CYA4_9GAMM|nr:DUF3833 domain-containing protein [Tamilnaduibacter salinus]PVY77474.1 uncharacterized protein DUF3833 [Tamilnaduibacter salinus]
MRVTILSLLLLLGGCAGPNLSDYRDEQPRLVPSEFFQGELTARGVVKDRSGAVIRTFDATIDASWDDDGVGTLDEVFQYNDGETDTRVWTLTPEQDGYRATAGDVTESGFMEWQGNAIHMNYVLEVPYGDGTINVRMDDWMYQVTPDTVINETTMSKWGVQVGEVVLVIQKTGSDQGQ